MKDSRGKEKKHTLLRYAVALSLPLLALGLQFELWPLLKPFAWLLFFPAVFAAAWIGGVRAGVEATVISVLLGWYFFIPVERSFKLQEPRHLLSAFVFFAFGIFLSLLRGRIEKTERRLNENNEALAHEIRELKRIRDELRVSEQKFHTLGEAVPQIVWITRPDGWNIYFNKRWVEYTGMTLEQSYGHGWNLPFHPDDQKRSWDAWKKAVETDGVYSLECRLRRADGVYRWWLIRGASLHDENGKVVNWFGTCTDVEDIKQTEEALSRARDEAEAANRKLTQANEEIGRLYQKTREIDKFKSAMFANVSHELRTPLTLILGRTETLLSMSLPEAAKQRLASVQVNALALLKQVNNILDVAKLEAGKLDVVFSEIDLAKLVRIAGSGFDSHARERGIHFSAVTPSSLLAQVDIEKVEHILTNLLSNAFKYTPADGSIRCELREAPGNLAVIEVADSGPGVPANYRDSIFERFFQVADATTHRPAGTGLGLSIVKDYVEALHGHVRVNTAPEGGALFTLEIPLRATEGATVIRQPMPLAPAPLLVAEPVPASRRIRWEQVPASTPPEAGKADTRKPVILVVEDHPEMRAYICETLGSEFSIETAANGREGLEKALRLSPDLIVSDLMMPEMSGDQMLRKIRASQRLESTPVILLTAKADDELRMELLKEGAVDYLVKPFLQPELKSKARNLLAVMAAERKYRGLLESAQDAIVVIGGDGKIKFANPQTTSWFGYSNEELVGKPIEVLVPERYRAMHVGDRDKYLGEPRRKQMAERMVDLRGRRKDGSEFPVSIALSPLQTPEGLLVTAIVRDISEMKKLSEQAILAREEAVAAVSHDLKNPLAAIQMSLQMISQGRFPTGKREQLVEKTLEIVERSSSQMTSIIQDLLDYSKIEAHRFSIEKKAEDVSSIISEVFVQFEPIARGKSIRLKREIPTAIGKVNCERGRIVRALSNFMSNAIKFTPSGGLITLSARLQDGETQFAVQDTGSGIAPEQLPHVFERYWQAEDAARKGTGLGLAIARGFVEAHHGKIWAESQVGHGSTFYFSLPGMETMAESA